MLDKDQLRDWCEFVSNSDQEEAELAEVLDELSGDERSEIIDYVFGEDLDKLPYKQHLLYAFARIGLGRVIDLRMRKNHPEVAGQVED